MPTSTQMIWLCGHCRRPVADNPTKWIGGVPFHVECTMSPYAGKVGCPNCNPAKMREVLGDPSEMVSFQITKAETS